VAWDSRKQEEEEEMMTATEEIPVFGIVPNVRAAADVVPHNREVVPLLEEVARAIWGPDVAKHFTVHRGIGGFELLAETTGLFERLKGRRVPPEAECACLFRDAEALAKQEGKYASLAAWYEVTVRLRRTDLGEETCDALLREAQTLRDYRDRVRDARRWVAERIRQVGYAPEIPNQSLPTPEPCALSAPPATAEAPDFLDAFLPRVMCEERRITVDVDDLPVPRLRGLLRSLRARDPEAMQADWVGWRLPKPPTWDYDAHLRCQVGTRRYALSSEFANLVLPSPTEPVRVRFVWSKRKKAQEKEEEEVSA
jgi:hypothetical protein